MMHIFTYFSVCFLLIKSTYSIKLASKQFREARLRSAYQQPYIVTSQMNNDPPLLPCGDFPLGRPTIFDEYIEYNLWPPAFDEQKDNDFLCQRVCGDRFRFNIDYKASGWVCMIQILNDTIYPMAKAIKKASDEGSFTTSMAATIQNEATDAIGARLKKLETAAKQQVELKTAQMNKAVEIFETLASTQL